MVNEVSGHEHIAQIWREWEADRLDQASVLPRELGVPARLKGQAPVPVLVEAARPSCPAQSGTCLSVIDPTASQPV